MLTSSQQQGVVFQEDYFADRQVTTNDNIGYYVLPYGYLTYRSRSDTDVFVFNRNNIIDRGIISYYYPVFLPKDCDSNFLLRRLNHGIKKQLSMAAEGTGQKVLAHNKFKNMVVDVPEIEEQQKIGLYFESLDHLITLHQRQPFLHSPPDISLIVQLTPPFYTFSWEQRKLGELALFNPKDELPQTFEYVDLESVVGTEMLSHRTEVKSSAPSRAQRLAHTGDLFYQTVRPYQKNNYLFEKPDNNYVFSTGYAQMRPYVDGYFLLSLVQSERFVKVVLDNCTGTSYPAINANDLAEIEVAAPSDESEAQKIGTIFRSIDNLITLHQRQTIVYAVIRSIRKVILAERQYFAPPMVRKSP